MRRDVKLLYDVMADTIEYIQVKMNAASLQLASIHSRSTQCARFARRDYKLTTLGASRGITHLDFHLKHTWELAWAIEGNLCKTPSKFRNCHDRPAVIV